LIGVLVVERMPFLSLTYENLQMLMVLMGYYADGVEHARATHGIQEMAPAIPYAFALDYARLSRLRHETASKVRWWRWSSTSTKRAMRCSSRSCAAAVRSMWPGRCATPITGPC
jgi:hypothetical protein